MRKALIFIFALFLMGCSQSDEQKAEKLVTEYLKEYANDPASVQDIEVGGLVKMKGMQKAAWEKPQYYKYASVSYRAKNGYGALMKEMVYVKFDTLVTKIICFDCID